MPKLINEADYTVIVFEQDVCWSEAATVKPGFSIKEIILQQSTDRKSVV